MRMSLGHFWRFLIVKEMPTNIKHWSLVCGDRTIFSVELAFKKIDLSQKLLFNRLIVK